MSENPEQENQTTPQSDEEVRIGVYTCYFGGNISDEVSCERDDKQLRNMPDVVISRTDIAMGSDGGQALIEKDS